MVGADAVYNLPITMTESFLTDIQHICKCWKQNWGQLNYVINTLLVSVTIESVFVGQNPEANEHFSTSIVKSLGFLHMLLHMHMQNVLNYKCIW